MSLLKRAVDCRPVGRPRSLTQKSTVCTWVENTTHDRLIQVANQRGMSVSEYVRRVVVFAIKDESSGKPT